MAFCPVILNYLWGYARQMDVSLPSSYRIDEALLPTILLIYYCSVNGRKETTSEWGIAQALRYTDVMRMKRQPILP